MQGPLKLEKEKKVKKKLKKKKGKNYQAFAKTCPPTL